MSETKALTLKPVDEARNFLNSPELKTQLANAANRYMTPERLTRIALTAVVQSPKLAECFKSMNGKASVAKALLTATQLGLEVDGRQAHLVPFRKKNRDTGEYTMECQLIPDYKGLIQLAYNHPKVKAIWGEAVYEKDKFVNQKGLNRNLEHVPYEGDDDAGKITHSYAVCEMEGGAKVYVVLNRKDIQRIRASSRSASEPDSIWNQHEAAMWVKSAIRALTKMIPQSNELRAAVDVDDEVEKVERAIDITPAKVPALFEMEPAKQISEQSQEPAAAVSAEVVHPVQNPVTSTAAAPKPTPQQFTADAVVAMGYNFSQFIKACLSLKWITDPDKYTSFDELPAGLCERVGKKSEEIEKALKATV